MLKAKGSSPYAISIITFLLEFHSNRNPDPFAWFFPASLLYMVRFISQRALRSDKRYSFAPSAGTAANEYSVRQKEQQPTKTLQPQSKYMRCISLC
jgi:hypothetical protein